MNEAENPTASGQQICESDERVAVQRTESLYSPALYFDSKRHILELLKVFADHGFLSLEDVAAALDRSSELASSKEVMDLKRRVGELEDALRGQKVANDLTAWELRRPISR